MTQHDPSVRMGHMLDHAQEALELLDSKTVEQVEDDRILHLALVRLVEVVGEAASKVPQEVRNQFPDIPWREAASTRNMLIHGYDIIRFNILCNTIRNHFPPLINQLEQALDQLDKPTDPK